MLKKQQSNPKRISLSCYQILNSKHSNGKYPSWNIDLTRIYPELEKENLDDLKSHFISLKNIYHTIDCLQYDIAGAMVEETEIFEETEDNIDGEIHEYLNLILGAVGGRLNEIKDKEIKLSNQGKEL